MRIHAIQTGVVQIKASQLNGRGHGLARRLAPLVDDTWTPWLPTFAWVIEHPEGIILVDTGASTRLKSLPRWHPHFRKAVRFEIEPEQEVGPQFKALGMGPKDVKQVVLTHLHIDHDAGLSAFPNSEVLVSRREIDKASGLAGRIRGYLPERWPRWFDPKPLDLLSGPYGPFARSRRLTASGDVIVVPTAGHTPDHVSIIVEDGETSVFLAGDVSYNERNMLQGHIDGISPDEGAAMGTLKLIREFIATRPTIFLPTHDPHSAQRLAQRQITRAWAEAPSEQVADLID